MKKLVTAAAALAILAPGLASAQDRGDRGGRGPGGAERGQYQGTDNGRYQGYGQGDRGQGDFRRGGDNGAPPPVQGAPQRPAAPQADPRADRGPGGGQGRGQGFQQGERNDRRFDDRGGPGGPGGPRFDNNRGGQADRRFDDNRRFDNRGGFNQNDRRFDNRGGYARFRAAPYRWPGGYRGAYSWRANQILPRSFLLRDYYIDNYYDFGFARPSYGYEWIRVGEDALLVNIYTGQIVDVAPGVFYW